MDSNTTMPSNQSVARETNILVLESPEIESPLSTHSPMEYSESPSIESPTDNDPEVGDKRLRSVAWKHFTQVKVNGVEKAESNYCKKPLGSSSRNGRPPNTPLAPTTPSTLSNGKYNKRKIANTKMPSTATRLRQAFAVVNGSVGSDLPPTSSGVIEFSKEDVEALLAEKRKTKIIYNMKENPDQMSVYIRRLKQCIRWFQQLEGTYVSEQASLKSLLESAEKKCEEIDMLMKSKEEELNATIMEVWKNLAVLDDNLKKEESEKLEALNSFSREKEARVAAESLQASLSDELKRAQQDLTTANQKIQFLNDKNKWLQEYGNRFQSELATTNETLKRVEKEKAAIVEYLSTLRGHCTSLREQLASSRAAQDEAIRRKETLASEVERLRFRLRRCLLDMRNDRERQLSTDRILTERVVKYNELEARYLSLCEEIRRLQEQLSFVEAKLQMSDTSALETKREYEMRKKVISELNQQKVFVPVASQR